MSESYAYLDVPRSEMVGFVPIEARSILDVGCGRGGFGAELRRRRQGIRITGIEADPAIAELARARYDEMLVGHFPRDVGRHTFDCVVFNDVLEHMVDPWDALAEARRLLTPGGTVVASIPNLRYSTVLSGLVLKRNFTYTSDGVLDRTHLRFFTEPSIRELFEASGFRVARLEPINLLDIRTVSRVHGSVLRMLAVASPGLATDLRAQQYAVLASPTD